MPDDLRTRIAAVARCRRWHPPLAPCWPSDGADCYQQPNDWDYELADAVIAELGLEAQAHYDPDCDYYRYVTDWINPLTGNKVDLP